MIRRVVGASAWRLSLRTMAPAVDSRPLPFARAFTVKAGTGSLDPVEGKSKKELVDVADQIEEVLAQEKKSPLTLKGGMGPVDEEAKKQQMDDLTAKIEADVRSKERNAQAADTQAQVSKFQQKLDGMVANKIEADSRSKETAIQSEDNQQVNKHHQSFDASTQQINEADKETKQSKTQEMGSIFDEEVKLTKEERVPGQGQTKPMTAQSEDRKPQKDENRYKYFGEDDDTADPAGFPLPTASAMMDAMKHTAESVKHTAENMRNTAKTSSVMDAMKHTAESVKHTAENMRHSAEGSSMMDTMKNTAQSLKQTGHDLKEAAKGSLKDMTEKAKHAMSAAAATQEEKMKQEQQAAEKQDKNEASMKQDTNQEPPKSKQEQFANSRQNSSIL